MKRLTKSVAVVWVIAGISGGAVEAQGADQTPGADPAMVAVYQNMHDAGMISDEEYQHALQYGTLPGRVGADAGAIDPATAQRLAEEAARRREEAWRQKKAEAAPRMRPLIPIGERISAEKRLSVEAEFEALRQKAARSRAEQPAKEQALEELSRRVGAAREIRTADGKRFVLADEIAGAPAYIASHNTVAAASISADELWPWTAWPYSEANTGLNLSGAGETLALWEVDGGVRVTHIEFGTRVDQRDDADLDETGHATQVAGTMAAGGVGTIFGSFAEGRGVAYAANVFAYDTDDLGIEREEAAAGNETDPAVLIANHSWGLVNGWRQQDITYEGNPLQGVWVWWGPAPANFPEDVKFGLYTAANYAGTGCEEIDLFLQADARRHLMMYSCGNDRFEGPGVSPGTYYWFDWVSDEFVTDTTVRDWDDGDQGGFDSLSAPGTAKNVLTVGACQDVFYLDGQYIVFGFGPGANAVPAAFSGAGPTDDGRLKPDLVTVGTPNLWLRQALGQVSGAVILGLISPTAESDIHYNLVARGTSYASPAVAGGLGLVLERRAELYPGLTPTEAWLNSTLKAIAIDTCDDVGAPGPDYRMGHGMFNARSAVERVGEDQAIGRGSLIKEFTLAVSQAVSWMVVSDGAEPLSVTIVWSDPPGPALTSLYAPDPQDAMLVNNLELTVEHVDSETLYHPWGLNPDLNGESAALRSAAATRGVDNRNNVERVSVAAPAAGQYRITVTHSGGLPGNPTPSAQPVSVVLGGVVPEPPLITELAKSPSANEFLLSFGADPGAYFTIEGSSDLINWAEEGSVLAEDVSNTVSLTSTDPCRFWRLGRAQ